MKSPLRFAGGKARDLPVFTKFFPTCGTGIEYREPFLGGGSVLLHALDREDFFDAFWDYWANDASPDVANFWRVVKSDLGDLVRLVSDLKEPYDGPDRKCDQWDDFKRRYRQKLDQLPDDPIHNAARFFILNRSTASGLTNSGGMTAAAYKGRFTDSSISRLAALKHSNLNWVHLTEGDYAPLLTDPAKDPEGKVFIFLDPPYFSAEKSGLYGRSGDLHKGFDHQRLAATLRDCRHQWLMTIDDCPSIRELYDWANLKGWEKLYSMANSTGKSKRGAELLVSNYPLGSE